MGELTIQYEDPENAGVMQHTEMEAVSALLIYVEELLKDQGNVRAAQAVFDADAVLRDEFALPSRRDGQGNGQYFGPS